VVKAHASYTGRALAAVLAAGPYAERKRFDAKAAAQMEAELEAPLKLGERELGVKMPWQEDGRQWHLVAHVNHHGQPSAWDVSVLEWIIDETEKLGEFAPTVWNHPSRVEIKAPGAETMWLLHARTRNTDLLDVTFRAPAGTFAAASLVRQLGIKPLNDRDDLPIYSGDQRVQIHKVDKVWDNIRILLRDQKDLNKSAFRSFLRSAGAAYFKKLEAPAKQRGASESWKDNAKNWHLTQGSMRARGKRSSWRAALLPQMIGWLNKINRDITIDWNRKVMVGLMVEGESIGAIVTNMPQGMRVYLKGPRNAVTPTRIERLGFDGEIRRTSQYDEVIFWMRTLEEVDGDQLKWLVERAVSRAASKEAQVV
jgi:excinuclease ABC subunit A